MQNYEKKKQRAIEQMNKLREGGEGEITLKNKATTHIWRERKKKKTIDLRHFNEVLSIDVENKIAEVEGMISYYKLSDETLKYNLIPAIVPELRNITVGGTISGLGVESTSFKFGMVPEIIEEVELLTSEAKVIKCNRKKNSDLFFMLANSWGTLGYVLKAKIKLIPAKNFVKINYLRFDNSKEYFEVLKKEIGLGVDFLDGAVFSDKEYVIVCGKFVDRLPVGSELLRPKKEIYYKHIRSSKNKDYYITTKDYLWRWDVDTFWGTDKLYGSALYSLQNPIIRKLFGWYFLRSDNIFKLRLLRNKVREFFKKFGYDASKGEEQVIQDVLLDIEKCSEFFDWYLKEINIFPVWICPINNKASKSSIFPLHKTKGDISVDIGFYYSKKLDLGMDRNHYNKLIEKEMFKFGATKGLYATSFYTEDDFWSVYDKKIYEEVKKKYDPENIFPNLYNKVVGLETA